MKTESVSPQAKYRKHTGEGAGLRSGEEERECQGALRLSLNIQSIF